MNTDDQKAPQSPESAQCSFALSRGMYCVADQGHDGQHRPGRAPVNGRPYGTISWAEHEEAWQDYGRRYSGQDALRIATRGGFGLWELCDHLGRAPTTWSPGVSSSERDVDGMKRLTKAAPEHVIDLARAIEHGRSIRPGTPKAGEPS
jgi:hypothetical protein